VQVAASKLRSAVGSILAEGDEVPNEHLLKTFTDYEYKVFKVPAAKSVFYTSFPFKGVLSVVIAVHRVYSALQCYAEVRFQACVMHCVMWVVT